MAEYPAQIKSIDFDDDECPSFVTVRIPAAMAAYLGMLTGKQNSITAEEVAPGLGAAQNSAAYELFSAGFANRFWDGGIKEAARELAEG